jgi:hypothetical protein
VLSRPNNHISRLRPRGKVILLALGLMLFGALTLGTSAGAAPQTPPAPTAPPTISGEARQGQTLTGSSGSWSGTTPISFAYQWQRCDSDGANCSNITAATGQTYTLATADVSRRLRVQVTATNVDGAATAVSAATDVVTSATAPVNTALPTTSGTEREGSVLTATTGTWTGSPAPTFAYQWLRCDQNGSNCAIINGATAQTYTLQSADVGRRMRVRVTATNSEGSSSADSAATRTVEAAGTAPANTSAPTISGNPLEGEVLTANRGQWSGTQPLSFAYQWQRCDRSGGSCSNIANATGQTWRLTSAAVGSTIRIRVTATNRRGSTTTISRATGVVAAAGPGGQIRLPDGKISIPVTSVSPPHRLIVSGLDFRPNPLQTRGGTITARFRILDTRGYVVRGALVFVTPLPYGWTTQPTETASAQDGWATVRMQATPQLPRRGAIVMFVRARKPGDFVLTGVSTRRLVQMLVSLR